MSNLQGTLLPMVELLGVMLASLILVSLLVLLVIAVVRLLVTLGVVRSYQGVVALRTLVGYPRQSVWSRRLFPVSSQNLIAMVGSAIGVWALIVVLSVMGGFEADLMGKIVHHNPHLTLRAGDGLQATAWVAGAKTGLASVGEVELIEEYVEGEAMVTSSTNMSPSMVLRGIHPEGKLGAHWLQGEAGREALRVLARPVLAMSDREMGFARERSGEDGLPTRPDDVAMPPIPTGNERRGRVMPGILLGAELAHSLSVTTGDEVIVVIPDGDVGPTGVKPKTRAFRVAGTFQSGIYEYDLRMAFLRIEDAQALFLQEGPNRVAAMLAGLDHLDAVAERVRAAISGDVEVVTVAQVNRSLFSALKIEKIAMFLVLGLVILVAGFNVFGSLTLITMEKTRDVAILQCLGATARGVRSIFLALGATIGLVGTTAGLLLGLASCAYVKWAGIRLPAEYYLRTLPVQVDALEVLLVTLAALGAAMVATLYPSMMVARLAPAEGLRND